MLLTSVGGSTIQLSEARRANKAGENIKSSSSSSGYHSMLIDILQLQVAAAAAVAEDKGITGFGGQVVVAAGIDMRDSFGDCSAAVAVDIAAVGLKSGANSRAICTAISQSIRACSAAISALWALALAVAVREIAISERCIAIFKARCAEATEAVIRSRNLRDRAINKPSVRSATPKPQRLSFFHSPIYVSTTVGSNCSSSMVKLALDSCEAFQLDVPLRSRALAADRTVRRVEFTITVKCMQFLQTENLKFTHSLDLTIHHIFRHFAVVIWLADGCVSSMVFNANVDGGDLIKLCHSLGQEKY
uniref:Uncharacterized protein n=1 Tax=Glossina austeni TaxID=7395 RepID=A0A1A9UCN9_GLOAU